MIDIGLSASEMRQVVKTLASPHEVAVQVHVLDLDHRVMGQITTKAVSGQVNVDCRTIDAPTRQLQLELVDPTGAINVDSDDGRPRINRMIRVHYLLYVGGIVNDMVAIPVFTGPISYCKREGNVLTIEALGKEALSDRPSGRAKTWPKNRNRVSVVQAILEDLTGETRFRFPKGTTARTAKAISLKAESTPWVHARALTKTMNMQLFYDGRGTCRMRRRPIRAAYTFRDGPGGTILTPPKTSENTRDIVNRVVVYGATPKGKKAPLRGQAFLHESHMYSCQSLRRGGKLGYRTETITDDSLRSQKEVDALAARRIKEIEIDEQEVTFECLAFPLLEEGDAVVVDSAELKMTARVDQFSLGLGHGGTTTIGYLAPIKRRKAALR